MVRILVIDDDDDFRSMLCTALEWAGYTAEEARNGQEGIRRHRTEPVDLVITDILMPEQEGLETIQALRQEFPAIKIIAISGEKGRLAAAQTFSQCTFEKPLNMEEFLDAVQAFASAPGSFVCMLQPCSLAAVHSVQGDA